MEKIEKLVKQISWDYANKPVVDKINEIIDRLNEQPEKTDSTKGCDCDFCRGYRWSHEKEKDTLEQTEEREDKIRGLLLQLTSPLKPTQFAIGEGAKSDERIISEIRKEVKQLLEEREREVLEEVLGAEVRHNSHSIFSDGWARRVTERVVDKLDKLNKEE